MVNIQPDKVQLNYPNIYLFAYYLPLKSHQHHSNQSSTSQVDNWLWSQCNTILNHHIQSDFQVQSRLNLDLKSYAPCINLIRGYEYNKSYESFTLYPNENNYFYQGKYSKIYALELYDSYAVGLSIIRAKDRANQKLSVEQIGSLNNNYCLLFDRYHKKSNFLGQTLIISVNLSLKDKRKNTEKLKLLADRYIDAIFPEHKGQIPFDQGGELFGSPIFQYGITRQWETYNHILVQFIKSEETETKFNQLYDELFDILLFRSRILHAYRNYRQQIKDAKIFYSQLESQVRDLLNEQHQSAVDEERLKMFQQKLISLPKMGLSYAEILRRLEKYQNTILIYTRDYADKLQEIQSIYPQEDLSFLTFFHQKTSISFQEEIAAELEYFHHGFSLIDKAISSIRGQVAIEQTKREREEQVLILALGTGIAAGGNLASSLQVAVPEHQDKFRLQNFALSFFTSLIFSLIISFTVWKYFNQLLIKRRTVKQNRSFD